MELTKENIILCWKRIEPEDLPSRCWQWWGHSSFMMLDGKRQYPHRAVWMLANNAKLGPYALKKECENSLCVNPAHYGCPLVPLKLLGMPIRFHHIEDVLSLYRKCRGTDEEVVKRLALSYRLEPEDIRMIVEL